MIFRTVVASAALLMLSVSASADDAQATIIIKDHRFTRTEVIVPAGKKVRLVIDNQDATPEEFESHDLNREKVIPGKSKATVWIGPLKPGSYAFVGEYHEATAKGRIVAR